MGKKDLKADMMELLREDYELQNLIRGIVSNKTIEKEKSSFFDAAKDGGKGLFGKSEKDYAAENKKLREMLSDNEQKVNAQVETIDRLKQESVNSRHLLSEAGQENDRLHMELSEKAETCRELTAKIQGLESTIDSFRESTNTLKQEATRLKRENEEQAQILSQRFAEGWELFCAYRNVSAQSKRLLSGVFVKPDEFTSFICGGAQDRSLEKIWDVIKGCLAQGNTNDADILWDIFEYAVELVNSAKTERIYEIMDVKPGVPFDLDIHTLAAGSKAQGNIREVYLLGYPNRRKTPPFRAGFYGGCFERVRCPRKAQ